MRAFDAACYHVWMCWPERWLFTRPALWLLQFAGRYANDDQSTAPRARGDE